MISIKLLATLLLIGHISSVGFMIRVLGWQIRLLRLPIEKEVVKFRILLFHLSLVIFLGNIIPILIDTLTLFINTGRPSHVQPISVAYALSNALVELVSALVIWTLYKLARDTNMTPRLPESGSAIINEDNK